MSWLTVGTATAGLASSFLGSKRPTQQLAPNVYNPYGEVNTPATGAINSRNQIFNSLGADQPGLTTATGNYASALTSAASDPRLKATSDYSMGVLRGDYLNSPMVNDYANKAAAGITAAGADTRARMGAALARGGQGFSTGALQAAQTGDAAAAAEAERTRAGIKMQNYQSERQIQNQAPGQVQTAVGLPSQFLSGVAGAYLSPLQAEAGLTTQLLGGQNQIKDQTLMQSPSFSDKLAAGLKTGTALADIIGQIYGKTGTGTGTGIDPATGAPYDPNKYDPFGQRPGNT